MKKLVFAVLAAFVMSLGMVSCSKSPQDKMVSLAEDMVSILKDTHIKSDKDVKELKEKMEKLKKESEAIQMEVEKSMEGLSDSEKLAKLGEFMEIAKKAEDISKQGKAEIERLKKEAEENKVDISGLDLDL